MVGREISGYSQVSPGTPGIPWYPKVYSGIPKYTQVSQSISGYLKVSPGIPKYPRVSPGIPKYSLVSQSIPGYPRVSQSIPGYPKVSQDSLETPLRPFLSPSRGLGLKASFQSCFWSDSDCLHQKKLSGIHMHVGEATTTYYV